MSKLLILLQVLKIEGVVVQHVVNEWVQRFQFFDYAIETAEVRIFIVNSILIINLAVLNTYIIAGTFHWLVELLFDALGSGYNNIRLVYEAVISQKGLDFLAAYSAVLEFGRDFAAGGSHFLEDLLVEFDNVIVNIKIWLT